MHFTSAFAGLVALASTTLAQDTQSAPFNLTVSTADGKYCDQPLSACHEGAAIESLCIYGSGTQFHLNTTQSTAANEPGVLTWLLPAGGLNYSESMRFSIDDSSNVAHPQFYPDNEATWVAFDDNNLMTIFSYLDDTVTPPAYTNGTALYRWYLCRTYWGYDYTTLNWVLGAGQPQNPSCVKADVKRVFVD